MRKQGRSEKTGGPGDKRRTLTAVLGGPVGTRYTIDRNVESSSPVVRGLRPGCSETIPRRRVPFTVAAVVDGRYGRGTVIRLTPGVYHPCVKRRAIGRIAGGT